MEKLIVIFHVYYHDQIDWFIDKLKNINGCGWDLVVTYAARNEESERKLRSLKPDLRLMPVENVGYDVWPFIKAIRSIDLSGYDYILKIHTKNISSFRNKINGQKLQGEAWRNMLVDALLKSPLQFRKCLYACRRPDTGLVCSYEMFTGLSKKREEDNDMLKAEEARIGITRPGEEFCAGTMFLVRKECLEKISKAEYTPDMWGTMVKSHSKGTLAHVYERIFCTAVTDAGYRIRTVASSPSSARKVFIHNLISPVMKFLFNIDYRYRNGRRRKHLIIFGLAIPV